jgi:hypothetical protein
MKDKSSTIEKKVSQEFITLSEIKSLDKVDLNPVLEGLKQMGNLYVKESYKCLNNSGGILYVEPVRKTFYLSTSGGILSW